MDHGSSYRICMYQGSTRTRGFKAGSSSAAYPHVRMGFTSSSVHSSAARRAAGLNISISCVALRIRIRVLKAA